MTNLKTFRNSHALEIARAAQAAGDYITANAAMTAVLIRRVSGAAKTAERGEFPKNGMVWVRDAYSPGMSLVVIPFGKAIDEGDRVRNADWIAAPITKFTADLIAEFALGADVICRHADWNSGEWDEDNPRPEVKADPNCWDQLYELIGEDWLRHAANFSDSQTRVEIQKRIN